VLEEQRLFSFGLYDNIVFDEYQRTGDEAVIAYIEVLPRICLGGTEKNQEQSARSVGESWKVHILAKTSTEYFNQLE
jgi:hypothetical protein